MGDYNWLQLAVIGLFGAIALVALLRVLSSGTGHDLYGFFNASDDPLRYCLRIAGSAGFLIFVALTLMGRI